MKDYSVQKLRNICLLAHGGGGKTTLAEAMLFNTGVLDRLGKVVDGTTTCDFDPEEIKRKISISTSLAPFEWLDHKINVIDTPGYFDFVGEVMQGIRAAEGAVIVVSAKSGVSVGTEKSWAYAKENGAARIFFINKMDEENANFNAAYDEMLNTFGNSVIPFQFPIYEDDKYVGYVDIINMNAKKFQNDKLIEIDIPSDLTDRISQIKNSLNELIAESDEELMEKFFSGEEFTAEEMQKGIKLGMAEGTITPLFCGSAYRNIGVKELMDAIVAFMPSPEAVKVKAKKAGKDEYVEIKPDAAEPMAALVFKTIADPFVGKISMFRVYSGTLKADSSVFNSTTERLEKIGQIFVMRGKKQIPTDKLIAGDIGGVAKLAGTNTNDTLCDQANKVILDKIVFPQPSISMAVEPKAKGDEEKISSGLHKLQDEDPTFKVSISTETHQTLILGVGEQHLDVIVSKLKAKFGVMVNLVNPKIPYRETVKKKVKVEGKHKKQSGGHGQYGHVWIEFEHGDTEDLTFQEKIFGGSVPKSYHPAVEKGLREAIVHGVLAGYPVVNLKATLVDGSYHDVDSSEMAFKIAARLAYKKGLPLASPVLLEPIVHVEVYVPESFMGDIIGDLNKRRGRILGMNPLDDGQQQVEAEVPQSEMFKYATDLRSMTQGRGYFKLWFERYEEAPAIVANKVIEEAKKNMIEENEE
ncbi:elongation factor G [Ruminiclostridium cellulolyticum]|uniref:Elongation factor G n=1 Tax=Ruminiclostridium cellulolyticum (strain ATCC 35319 / DSM 5812 / JCM 6584 / H10) TaxID=394503 RepID=B8I873_RUMCH|nr:elongation factor G [Ruminiclostridium cellulolyticum]ACL77173.1 translation elongation factor G [Ruminiclostridium cellulolyticum H10]